jgi:hypothetical protein
MAAPRNPEQFEEIICSVITVAAITRNGSSVERIDMGRL